MPERFHQVQYLLVASLAALFALLYFFAPEPRSDLFASLAATALGFVVGKFSNGYKKSGSDGG